MGSGNLEFGNSLIIPVYRNADTARVLVSALKDLSIKLKGDLEVVLVVDGSPDESHGVLQELLEQGGLRAQLLSAFEKFWVFCSDTQRACGCAWPAIWRDGCGFAGAARIGASIF